jgi:hypothetical protein
MPDVLVQDRLVASVGLDGDMATAKQHGKSVVVYADADRIVVLVWEASRGGDAFLILSHPSVALVRSEGLEVAEPDCLWQGVEYIESDMQADCWRQSEDRGGLEWEYRIWGNKRF